MIKRCAEFDGEIDLATLRRRTSEKWLHYPADVLPLFVAETDFPTPPAIARALREAIELGDLGYAHPRNALGQAYSTFSREYYGHEPDPNGILAVPEVMVGAAEILRAITGPNDSIVINPPVYPPFFSTIAEVKRPIVEVPLLRSDRGEYSMNLIAIEKAFEAGARVFLYCNPHNPVGRVASREEVMRVAELAARYDVAVLADEIHAPLVLSGAVHTPFESAVAETGVKAITLTSASKGWNIAGLKCALAVTSSDWGRSVFKRLPSVITERAGILGIIATIAAFAQDVPFLERVKKHLDAQRHTLRALLDDCGLQKIGYTPPPASFLAWLDCRELNLGPNPSGAFLKRGKVAFVPGLAFGAQGAGFVRLNFATSTEILEEAVRRMSSVLE